MENQLFKLSNIIRTNYAKINGVYYELSNIIFYNENGVITQTKQGFFDGDEILQFNGEVKKKIKENFNLKENYIITDKTTFFDKRFKLYVYEKNVSIKNTGLIKKYNSQIYNVFFINESIRIDDFIRSLENEIFNLKIKIENEFKKINYYSFPFDEKELTKTLNKIKKYNKQILQIQEYNKHYTPTTLENEIKIKEEEKKRND